MELSRERVTRESRGQAEFAACDLVGELLASCLEKQNVEVVIDSERFQQSHVGIIDDYDMIHTMVDCEEIVETDELLEITLSGGVQKDRGLLEPFMLLFTLSWDKELVNPKKRAQKRRFGTNTMWLQFGCKAEQMTDTVFSVHLYRNEVSGEKLNLGSGQGFFVSGREKYSFTN